MCEIKVEKRTIPAAAASEGKYRENFVVSARGYRSVVENTPLVQLI